MERHQKLTSQSCTCLHSVFACIVSMNTWLTSHGNTGIHNMSSFLSHHYRRPLSELLYQFVCQPTVSWHCGRFCVMCNKLWVVMSQTFGLVQVSVISSVLSMMIPRLAFYNTLRPSPSGRHFAEDNFECIFFKKSMNFDYSFTAVCS